ncbi:hypothetical protein FRC07_004138 [Ceratobasidium sp. 392]|nr:hypothetical protein FRC07_004138 [Ceratobasidium sp. 392]
MTRTKQGARKTTGGKAERKPVVTFPRSEDRAPESDEVKQLSKESQALDTGTEEGYLVQRLDGSAGEIEASGT